MCEHAGKARRGKARERGAHYFSMYSVEEHATLGGMASRVGSRGTSPMLLPGGRQHSASWNSCRICAAAYGVEAAPADTASSSCRGDRCTEGCCGGACASWNLYQALAVCRATERGRREKA